MKSHSTRVNQKGRLHQVGFLVLMALFLMFPGKGFAAPFSSTAWVDPNFGNSWSSLTLEGTARYAIYINTPGVNVNGGGIEFENDIFDLSVLDLTDVAFVAPASWGANAAIYFALDSNLANNTTSVEWTLGGGLETISDATDPIIIEVKYKLLSASRYLFGDNNYAGELAGWEWDEAQGANQSWSQRYQLLGTDSSIFPVAMSGGSTAQVVTAQAVPEPGTLLLLGSGLLGCVALARLRGKKTNG